jgi:hypothetical protein
VLRKGREYELNKREFYLNESLSVTLVDGTFEELVNLLKGYDIDEKYLGMYIQVEEQEKETVRSQDNESESGSISSNSDDVMSAKDNVECVDVIEEDVEMKEDNQPEGNVEEPVEDRDESVGFMNQDDGTVEAVDPILQDNVKWESVDPIHLDEDKAEAVGPSQDISIEELDKEIDLYVDMLSQEENNSQLVNNKEDDIDINEVANFVEDECTNINNNIDVLNSTNIYNRFLPPNEELLNSSMDHFQGYKYSSLLPYEEDYPARPLMNEQKDDDNELNKEAQEDKQDKQESVAESISVKSLKESSDGNGSVKDYRLKEEQILEELNKEFTEQFVPHKVPEKEEIVDSVENLIEDEMLENKSEKETVVLTVPKSQVLENVEDNSLYNIFKFEEKQRPQPIECNFDDMIDSILNETTILNPPRSTRSRKDIDRSENFSEIDSIAPRKGKSRKDIDRSENLSEVSSVVPKSRQNRGAKLLESEDFSELETPRKTRTKTSEKNLIQLTPDKKVSKTELLSFGKKSEKSSGKAAAEKGILGIYILDEDKKLLNNKRYRSEKKVRIALADYDITQEVENQMKELNYEIVDDHDLIFDLLLCDKLSKKIKVLIAINKVTLH